MALSDRAQSEGNETTISMQGNLTNNTMAVAHLGHWRTWRELEIRIFGIPSGSTTLDIWQLFHKEGKLDMIELYVDSNHTYCTAKIRFSPPPSREVWKSLPGVPQFYMHKPSGTAVPLRLELEMPRRTFWVQSPVRKEIAFPERITLYPSSLEFGMIIRESALSSMRATRQLPDQKITLHLDSFRRKILDIQFPLEVNRETTPGAQSDPTTIPLYRFTVQLKDLKEVQKVNHGDGTLSLIITLDSPPRFFRRFNNVASSHAPKGRYWTDWDAWYRQTDIVSDPSIIKNKAISLRKPNAIIDLGRWTTYRFVMTAWEAKSQAFLEFLAVLEDYNISIKENANFVIQHLQEPSVWDWIDSPIGSFLTASSALLDMQNMPALAFPIRYQLEVCISQGILNERNICRDFVDKLLLMEERKAVELLEHITSKECRIYSPMSIFHLTVTKGSHTKAKIPQYCVYSRKAKITPTMIYYSTPSVEISNRVIRHYMAQADRFLRVQFTDEKTEGDIGGTDKSTSNEVFTRIKRAMVNGVTIGDRHFEFLAFGNSQFRERGAFFFSPTSTITTQSIRKWMGFFEDIKIVAKYAARLGQCFSTTRAITGTSITVLELADVVHHGFDFTDGVGRMSPFIAQMIKLELNLQLQDPPSVVQFRLGGCKGVLAIHPDVPKHHLRIRKSQYKFAAKHLGLEIVRWSQFAAASLNRQLILVLSALGVADGIFLQKQNRMLTRLALAVTDEHTAIDMLQKNVDPNGATMTIANLVKDGFMKSEEPFVLSILRLWRSWSIKYLKEKAKIMVENGAFVLGCTDESGTLKGWNRTQMSKGHTDKSMSCTKPGAPRSKEQEISRLPEIFLRISDRERPGFYNNIKGVCIVARNPSLHPGDIRVVNAVDSPLLHHLRDVVVFPQNGDRDIPSMCSGGDLDGDDYIVMWDRDLIPEEWNHEPMDFIPPAAETVENVTVDDITSFFTRYMKNDKIGQIAHAHLAHADAQSMGVKSRICLELAELHSLAVDYAKTGYPAKMKEAHRVRRWPHFMEKSFKAAGQIYQSEKVLGQLYDHVERVDFVPHFTTRFDNRILKAHIPDSRLLGLAKEVKMGYDSDMRRIMAQHSIRTEFEVWSTFVLSHDGRNRDFKFHEIIGQLSQGLKDTYRTQCIKLAGGKEFQFLGPFVVAMYSVAQEQMEEAITEAQKTNAKGASIGPYKSENMPLMTFPWIFPEILSRIAKHRGGPLTMPSAEAVLTAANPTPKIISPTSTVNDEFGKLPDDIVTNSGITRRGDILELFANSSVSEKASTAQGIVIDTSKNQKISTAKGQVDVSPGPLAASQGSSGKSENCAPLSGIGTGKQSHTHEALVISNIIEDDAVNVHPAFAALDKLSLEQRMKS